MGLLPSPSSLWRPVLYRWLTLPSHHCPSDAQWGGFWLFAAGYYFPRHFLMTLPNRSRLSWAQNRFCTGDTKRQGGLFHATAQVGRQARPILKPHRHPVGKYRLHSCVVANGYSQGRELLFAFSPCHECPSVLNINETIHSLFCRLKIFSIKHTVLFPFQPSLISLNQLCFCKAKLMYNFSV